MKISKLCYIIIKSFIEISDVKLLIFYNNIAKVSNIRKNIISVRDADKPRVLSVARELVKRGYSVVATSGTAKWLMDNNIACEKINKVTEGRPHVVDLIKNDEITYIVNTTEGRQAIADSFDIRRGALQHRITWSTTVAGAKALLHSLDHRGTGPVLSLQELHATLNKSITRKMTEN